MMRSGRQKARPSRRRCNGNAASASPVNIRTNDLQTQGRLSLQGCAVAIHGCEVASSACVSVNELAECPWVLEPLFENVSRGNDEGNALRNSSAMHIGSVKRSG